MALILTMKDQFWKSIKRLAVRYAKRNSKDWIGNVEHTYYCEKTYAAYLAGAHMGWKLRKKLKNDWL